MLTINKIPLTITTGIYENGRLCVVLDEPDGECWTVLSVNIPEAPAPAKNQFWAKTWSENEPYRDELLKSGYFEDMGGRFPTGFVTAELWKLVTIPRDLL